MQKSQVPPVGTQVAGTSHTPEKTFPSSLFPSSSDLLKHATNILSAVTSHQEIVYTDVPPSWAGSVLDRLDVEFEGRSFRKNYNAATSQIWIRTMPTELHDCHQSWIDIQKCEWIFNGLLTPAETALLKVRMGTKIKFVGGPYPGSRKEPDLLIRPDSQLIPSVVIESGWSESVPRLQQDMNLWLVGGQGVVRSAIIIKWKRIAKTNTVQGDLEQYGLDLQGLPVRKDAQPIFPAPIPAAGQQIVLTRRELFGIHMLPGSNPADQFPLDMNLLRHEASIALGFMNLRPA